MGTDDAARERALQRLPETYAAALRLRDAGLSGAEIAARLNIDPAALGPLLQIADAKLATLLSQQDG